MIRHLQSKAGAWLGTLAGNTLRYRWFEYVDINPAYAGVVALRIEDAATARTKVTVPAAATAGTRYHVILEARDDGTPFITRYRRIIIDVRPGAPQGAPR